MQEPGSPLVPLDPTRLQQQMQQPMRETVTRTISTSSVGSLESVGAHYMEMQAPSTPQFQQQMSPQFSPLPTGQQRFWNPQPSPRPAYQQQQQQSYNQMIRMPAVSQQSSQNSQSPRVPLIGPLAQAISPDMVKLSSPNAGQSPMGSPVQPQTPSSIHQQQQPMSYQQQAAAAAMYQQQQQQQQQQMIQVPYQQQMNHPSGMVPQHQFQTHMMSQYPQQSQVNQNFANQPMARQSMVMGQQQLRMMAPPQGQPMGGQRIVMSQPQPRFLQGNQPMQQNMYSGQQPGMMYVVQQQQQQQPQQRMPSVVNAPNPPPGPQYQSQHPSQPQFSGYAQQYMPTGGQGAANYGQTQQPPGCMPQQQQAVMQQIMPGTRYGVPAGHTVQMVPQNQPQPQQGQQSLHFQPRPPHTMPQQYHPYQMQMQQQYSGAGSSSSSHVQQQQQHNAASQSSNTNAVQQPLQQALPPSSVAAQHQQIMYQGSSPVNGPRQPNVVGASPQNTMIRHAAFINAGSGPPPPQHMMAMGHGPSAPQQGGPLQSATPDSMRPQYFGHDPNVTIPSDMCLLGCVFLIVDYDRILDQKEVSDWRTVIVQHGGEVETSYSNKCTHVICESLRHPVVQQALKESKRCVTAQWLNDCILLKRMQPPWRSVHFPSPFGDNKPCKNRIFSVCGFDANERSCLKQMIMAVGARYTTYLSRHNTLLIAKIMEGQQKVVKAKEWKIPILNVQWLTELFLGQQAVLQNMNNPKYLQFMPKDVAQQGNVDLFRIDPTISPVLVLMTAWRTPIVVNADCWKLASDRKQKLEEDCKLFPYKKIKLSPAPDEEEIENNRKESQNAPSERVPKICFTGLYQAEVENLTKKALWLNAVVVQDVKECTHLVASDLKRTRKLLESIALGRFIVSPLWIRQSYKQQQFADCIDYIVKDEGNEKFFGFNIKLSIYRARLKRLFEDMIFYLTPSVQPYPSTLIDLIQTSGGSVLQQRPPSNKIAELQQNGVQIIIITCDNDLHLCQHLLELGIAVHSAEFILTGILRQEVDFTSYRIEPKQTDGAKPGRDT